MKTVETYIYYVIYSFKNEGYYSGILDTRNYRTEYKYSKLLKDAVTWDSRADANEYVRAYFLNGDDKGKFKVKKLECDYKIS